MSAIDIQRKAQTFTSQDPFGNYVGKLTKTPNMKIFHVNNWNKC